MILDVIIVCTTMNKMKNWILQYLVKLNIQRIRVPKTMSLVKEFNATTKHKLMKGDTASINGIPSIYFEEPKLGVIAIRPIPAFKMNKAQACELESRGLEFYVTSMTALYHLEGFEENGLFAGPRVVLVEKTTEHLIRQHKQGKILKFGVPVG